MILTLLPVHTSDSSNLPTGHLVLRGTPRQGSGSPEPDGVSGCCRTGSRFPVPVGPRRRRRRCGRHRPASSHTSPSHSDDLGLVVPNLCHMPSHFCCLTWCALVYVHLLRFSRAALPFFHVCGPFSLSGMRDSTHRARRRSVPIGWKASCRLRHRWPRRRRSLW